MSKLILLFVLVFSSMSYAQDYFSHPDESCEASVNHALRKVSCMHIDTQSARAPYDSRVVFVDYFASYLGEGNVSVKSYTSFDDYSDSDPSYNMTIIGSKNTVSITYDMKNTGGDSLSDDIVTCVVKSCSIRSSH